MGNQKREKVEDGWVEWWKLQVELRMQVEIREGGWA